MPDLKISLATNNSTVDATDEFATNKAGANRKTQASAIKTFVNTAPVFGAGSASANSWPKLTTGTLLTTPESGAIEFDSDCAYFTNNSGRACFEIAYLIRQDASRNLTSQTGAQAVFNASTNGRITLALGTYEFYAIIALSNMSGTTGNATFDLAGGTAVLGSIIWHGFGRDAAADSATNNYGGSFSVDNTLTAAPLLVTATATGALFKLEGTFEVTTSGTVQLRILLQTAAAATVAAGSYMKVLPLGSTTRTIVGPWD